MRMGERKGVKVWTDRTLEQKMKAVNTLRCRVEPPSARLGRAHFGGALGDLATPGPETSGPPSNFFFFSGGRL